MRATLRLAARAAGWVAGACLAGGSPACSEAERPAPIEDLHETAPPPRDSLIDPEDPKPDLMSPCGAATAELDFVRPNLYFAIDASGSMNEGIPAGDTASLGARFPPADRYG